MNERWFDEVRVFGGQAVDAEGVRAKFVTNRPPDLYRVEDLVKTPFERQAVTTAVAAVNGVLADLGLPTQEVGDWRVHVVAQAEFHEKVAKDSAGKAAFGHVYIQRREDDPGRFIHDLTHELCHTTGFFAIGVLATKHSDGWRHAVAMRRFGLAFNPFRQNEPLGFAGFAEAATELVANRVRNRLIKGSALLDAGAKDMLANTWAHYPAVLVAKQIVADLASATFRDPSVLIDMLFRDHFTGSYGFMYELSRTRKDAVRMLFRMRPTAHDAMTVAATLGHAGVAERIARHIAQHGPA